MILLAVVAMLCGTVLLIGHRASLLFSAKWRGESATRDRISMREIAEANLERERDRDAEYVRYAAERDLDARRIVVLERELVLKERLQAERPPNEPIPVDLHNRITAWEDEFAQEQERQTLMALYSELRDWDKVRSKLPALNSSFETEPVAPRDGFIQ